MKLYNSFMSFLRYSNRVSKANVQVQGPTTSSQFHPLFSTIAFKAHRSFTISFLLNCSSMRASDSTGTPDFLFSLVSLGYLLTLIYLELEAVGLSSCARDIGCESELIQSVQWLVKK